MTVTDIKDITSFKWATVTAISPLAIKLDGDTAALALVPESIVDPLELAVGTRVRVELSLRKAVIHGAANGGSPSGEIKITAAAAAPAGWLLAQGQSLLRASYPGLFAVLGTTYGAADSTHFSVPDMRGRVAVGRDAAQVEFDVLGETGGEKAHTLSNAEMPVHRHGLGNPGTGNANATYNYADIVGGGGIAMVNVKASYSKISGQYMDSEGGSAAHNNLQPYMALNYIIKT